MQNVTDKNTTDKKESSPKEGSQQMPIPLDPNRLWTFEEARYYLRVSDSTLRKHIRSGRLPAVRVGGAEGRLILVKKEDLDALLIPIKPSLLDGPDYSVVKPSEEEYPSEESEE